MINSQLDIFDLKRLQIPQNKHELVEGGKATASSNSEFTTGNFHTG